MNYRQQLIFIIFTICLTISSEEVFSQAQISNGSGVIFINKNTAEDSSLEGKRGGFFGTHSLGDSIQFAFDKFLKYYVEYESSGGAYATEKKVINKGEIYKSILELDKFYKKAVKKEEIPRADAVNRYFTVLSNAIAIRYYDTSNFENILKVTKDIGLKEQYFLNLEVR